ncbi:MAG: AMIN domain-containing protein [Terriglobales bacterium]
MRIDAAVSLIFLAAVLAAPRAASQDAAGLASSNSRPAITSVSVAEGVDGVDVEVAFSELVQPEVSRLQHPDRLVFDFPGCKLAGPGQRFVVNRGPVIAVSSETAGAGARVIVELRSEPRSTQNSERAAAANKLVVNLSSVGNNLIIELGGNRDKPRPALASAGTKPALNSQPPAPKSTAMTPPMPAAPPLVLKSDRLTFEPSVVTPPAPSVPAVMSGRDRLEPKSAEAVPPTPSAPDLALRSDRSVLEIVTALPPVPSVPALARLTNGMSPSAEEVLPPMPTSPSPALKRDRATLESVSASPPMLNVPTVRIGSCRIS